jgi:SNF2 family DNA or RNA helicase
MTLPLLAKQTKAISKLQQVKVGALFMEPGAGKTLPAFRLAKSVPELDYVLWLTPFQTKANLLSEIVKYGGFDCALQIEGIESLSNSDRLYLELINKLNNATQPMVIVDESLKIKNWDAKRTRRIVELGKLAQYKLILNGTPLSRNLLDLWPQFEFLDRRILQMDQAQFKNTFVEYTTVTKRLGHKVMTKEFINRYHNVDYLLELIEPYVFEADLDIDTKKQYINCPYSLTSKEKAEHNEIKAKYLDDERMQWRNNNIFLEITQLLQHNYSLSPEKFDIAEEIIKNNGHERVLIFAKYIDTQEALKKRFPDVRILSWQKHAFGLNLQHYNRIIFFDKVWDYALRDQAEHRVYRTGQTEDCVFYDLTGNVGLESLIDKNIAKKESLLNYFKTKSVKELMEKL